MNRLAARRAALASPATAFLSQPEPRTIGSFARGRQLCAGNFLFAGQFIQSPGTDIWDLDPPDRYFAEELHGFVWLDDLAATGDTLAREKAQTWIFEWTRKYGGGSGPGWTPDLAGRRMIRWISHAFFIMRGLESRKSDAFLRSLGQQARFLRKRWHAARPGLSRIEALTGLLYAGLSLEGMGEVVGPAKDALARECDAEISQMGLLPSRNPEDLLDIFTLLTWAAMALEEAGDAPPEPHRRAIERIAPTLRTLRHADGGLARFHGGGRGLEGRLDAALASSGIKTRAPDGLAMGFARMSAGRTTIIIDASAPPSGPASAGAHASTLAFELTSGRRPMVVNCGSGHSFGADWRRAGRATPSHSTLVLAGESSARLGPEGHRQDWLVSGPTNVPIETRQASDGLHFEGAHDGYLQRYGLTHARSLDMTFDGRGIAGEDMLIALDKPAQSRFDEALDADGLKGLRFDIRFHLHPDADATMDMGGNAISIALKSGEIWIFRSDGPVEMKIAPSVYLEKSRLRPRATKQIVLSGRAMEYATRTRWSLAKAQDTPIGIRDVSLDNPISAVEDPDDKTKQE
ncbi:heparinase II/III family protein [Roseovarius sp. SCSIO 43702]|uniref:heparinase II/III family protein n=1 Tax=Roseovarius sp. SCSIO 43702 TaxID=2823043 RepID=UPI001C738902|nr:heparinase II/III family protein [Roseovarius sp. SCSIO 43702]QYX57047.1 heparinase II/III family protein [Roseovarius sp. SCSIO 43702]